jgi:hypothetical protein
MAFQSMAVEVEVLIVDSSCRLFECTHIEWPSNQDTRVERTR